MLWDTMTNRVDPEGMIALEKFPTDSLKGILLAARPLMTLWGLTELRLHNSMPRLRELLQDQEVWRHCQRYKDDKDVTAKDHTYFATLARVRSKN